MGEASSEDFAVKAMAPGKVNLVLKVGPRKADGYHDLLTCFHAVDLWETVTVRPSDRYCVTIDGDVNLGEVPLNDDNLVVKAAKKVADVVGVTRAVSIHIDKRVPVGGGMGGGSADAAATLVAVNELWDAGLSDSELLSLAATLGADVPFALAGNACVGRGNGSALTPIESTHFCWVVIPSAHHLATPGVYQELDDLRGDQVPTLPSDLSEGLTSALFSGDAKALAGYLDNDMEAAALSLYPDLAAVMEATREAGALRVMVSGSGPTCVGLADNQQHATEVATRLNEAGTFAFTVMSGVRGAHLVPVP